MDFNINWKDLNSIMKIQNVENLSFKSIRYRNSLYMDKDGVMRTTQNTTQVRPDLDCRRLAKVIRENFADREKINIMPMNCSDLTEGYAIASAIIDEFGEDEAKKRFFPIQASDVDEFMIDKFAKKGLVALDNWDTMTIGEENIKKYFNELPDDTKFPLNDSFFRPNSKKFQAKDEFRSLFEVDCVDFQKRIENLDDGGNSVVLITNCLADSFGLDAENVINSLSDKLKMGSLFVTGLYDRINLPELRYWLKNGDFLEISPRIFYKNSSIKPPRIVIAFQKLFKHLH